MSFFTEKSEYVCKVQLHIKKKIFLKFIMYHLTWDVWVS